MKNWKFISLLFLMFLTSCSEDQSIVSNVDEQEANGIIVFLASNGIGAYKVKAASEAGAGAGSAVYWSINVDPGKAVEAMSLLSQNGLPKKRGTNLLTLFAKEGLMTSDKEDKIRYQAGMEQELENAIRKIDGVIDVNVKISFPTSEEALPMEGAVKTKMKAAVYVKHHGILDNPNNHLETKIKRFLSNSIDGLDFENVAVISDHARFANVTGTGELISTKQTRDVVSLWSIVMTKESVGTFKLLFAFMSFLILLLSGAIGWMVFKFYPVVKKAEKKNE